MGIREYFQSQEIEGKNYDFYAIVMAAMRNVDTDNLEKLQAAFPETWEELLKRYNAPGGVLERSEVSYAAKQLIVKESELLSALRGKI